MEKIDNLIIVPARKGSKGIPGKNMTKISTFSTKLQKTIKLYYYIHT